MRFASRTSKALVFSAVLALSAAACTGAVQGAGGSDGSLTVRIATPAEGATVSVPFDVQLESSVALGEPGSGNHHVHLYFDTSTDSGDYDIVYGTSSQVTRQLAPGEHTITAALANPDHSLAGPTAVIHVTIGTGSGGGGTTPSAPASTPGYSY